VTAPPFGPALATLEVVLALPLTALASIAVHDWWRNRHPRTEERP
jgi:hypothetical protein